MPWLLDTNAWIHYLKDPGSPIRIRLANVQPTDILTCSIVRAELLHGALKYGNAERRRAIVIDTLAPFVSLPFDDAAAERYANLRSELQTLGKVIGPLDMQIAAICLAAGCTLVTHNVGEFSRVNGLQVEDWLAIE